MAFRAYSSSSVLKRFNPSLCGSKRTESKRIFWLADRVTIRNWKRTLCEKESSSFPCLEKMSSCVSFEDIMKSTSGSLYIRLNMLSEEFGISVWNVPSSQN